MEKTQIFDAAGQEEQDLQARSNGLGRSIRGLLSDSTVLAWAIVLIFFLLWESAVRIWQIPAYLLPAPSNVLMTLANNGATYTESTWEP